MSFVEETLEEMFQSPRSGKFVSNKPKEARLR